MSNLHGMLSIPVIMREMLVTARSPLQYQIRSVAVALAGIFMTAVIFDQTTGDRAGLESFTALHGTLIAMILIMSPALSANAISMERREGTLDLLFLTPLSGAKIVSSKLFSHGLRIVTIWLACLPVAIVPVLAGGVDPMLIGISLCVQFSCIVLSLMASLTCSALLNKALGVMVSSIGATLCVIALNYLLLLKTTFAVSSSQGLVLGLIEASAMAAWLPVFLIRLGAVNMDTFALFAADLALILCVAPFWALALGRFLTPKQQNEERSAMVDRLRRVFLTPCFFRKALNHLMRQKIERNPLIWLEYRSPWSRSARWLVVALVVLAESYMMLLAPFSREFAQTQIVVGLLLVLLICFTASSSFQREKENGAFELLLIAPMTVERLIYGRLTAVWSYYKPAAIVFGLFVFLSLNIENFDFSERGDLFGVHLLSATLSAFTIPVAGLYFALKRRAFIAILISAAFCGMFLPYFSWDFLRLVTRFFDNFLSISFFRNLDDNMSMALVATMFLHGALINFFAKRTVRCLERREFAV